MEEMIGKVIGSYVVTRLIGEGGMGTVWAGKHETIDRHVAIKVLHPQFSRNDQIRERFRKEAGLLARLQHPNIVALYDYIERPSQVCLVMEYVDGIDLDQMIRKETGPLPQEKLNHIFGQMVAAIGYAHRNQVVHRDIKPSNIMVTKDGTVKVLDFGIAKWVGDEQQLTRTGIRLGTTSFMSPEQVEGKSVDRRSDIYSLGVTLFVLATGSYPYANEASEFQVYNKIVNDPLPKPSSIYPGVVPNVELLIAHATAKDPAARMQRCEDFFAGLGMPQGLENVFGSTLWTPSVNTASAPQSGSQNVVANVPTSKSAMRAIAIVNAIFSIIVGITLIFTADQMIQSSSYEVYHTYFSHDIDIAVYSGFAWGGLIAFLGCSCLIYPAQDRLKRVLNWLIKVNLYLNGFLCLGIGIAYFFLGPYVQNILGEMHAGFFVLAFVIFLLTMWGRGLRSKMKAKNPVVSQ